MPPQRPDALDLEVVARQLGRPRCGVHPVARIVARCPWQLPVVVESLPYGAGGEPFPTLFYLTCPTAVAAVSRVETADWSREFGAHLSASAELLRTVAAAEAFERRRRARLAAGAAAAGAALARDGGASLSTGIGGTRGIAASAGDDGVAAPAAGTGIVTGLKCLHAHAAHALARPGYGFGALVLEQARAAAGSLWCGDARCTCSGVAVGTVSDGMSDSFRLAVVDLGTNTCRLLLGRVGSRWCGPIEHEARVTSVVRLGQGVDHSGRLAADAVLRTRACLAGYAARIERFRPAARLLIATSALRDAADGPRFLAAVQRDFGLPWRILSGGEEAATAFRGAVCGLAGVVADHGADSVLVVDIGGGSTELIVGQAGAEVVRGAGAEVPPAPAFACSVDVGAVRLTEQCFHHDPPTPAEWNAAVRRVRSLLRASVPLDVRGAVGAAVGVAGTITTLVANKLALQQYRSELVNGQPLHLWEIERAIALFRTLSSVERARLPGIQPGREDVILAGALIAREACLLFGLPGLLCGESDILEGAALQLADEVRERGPEVPADGTSGGIADGAAH